MQQIKIIFCVLGSFFGIEDAHIAADKTTITINPKEHAIEIIQENVFAVIKSEKDTTLVLEMWDKLLYWKERNILWAKELDSFSNKNLTFTNQKKTIQPHLKLRYSNESDLKELGIWFNAEKNQFYMNHIPQYNLKTKDGTLEDRYWVFSGDSTFSFTVEPFLKLPEKQQKLKHPIEKLLLKHKKE